MGGIMGNPQSLETGTVADSQVVILILISTVWLRNNIWPPPLHREKESRYVEGKTNPQTEEKSLEPPEGVRMIVLIPLFGTFFF